MNYIVEYKVLSSIDAVIKIGKTRCKNKATEFEAVAGLSDHLAKTVPAFHKMVVIRCVVEKKNPDLFNIFDWLK